LVRRRQVGFLALAALVGGGFLANDVVAQFDALVADEHRRARNQLADLVLALAAERAVKQLLAGGGFFRHQPGSLEVRTLSTMPYFTATSADRKLSRSVSLAMVS